MEHGHSHLRGKLHDKQKEGRNLVSAPATHRFLPAHPAHSWWMDGTGMETSENF